MLSKGANTLLVPAGSQETSGVVVGLRWASSNVELHVSAFVVDKSGQALGDEHFVFFNNPNDPDRSVWLLEPEQSTVADNAQIAISLPDLPSEAQKVIITVATLDQGKTLSSVTGLSARAFSLQTGADLATVDGDTRFEVESLVQVLEIYRHPTGWKVRAVLQGYAAGLAGIANDVGIEVG